MVYAIGMLPIMGQYPEEEFLDGSPPDVKLRGPITDEMKPDISIRHAHQYSIGFPVAPNNVPTIWRWASSQPVPDFCTPHGFPCISPRVKEMVEQFEPDVHQFFPLKVVDKFNRQIAEHFLWVICNRVDGVDREHTNWFFRHNCLWTPDYIEDGKRVKIENPNLVFNRSQTDGYHFWYDKHLKNAVIYASDAVGDYILESDFGQLSASPRETV